MFCDLIKKKNTAHFGIKPKSGGSPAKDRRRIDRILNMGINFIELKNLVEVKPFFLNIKKIGIVEIK